MSQIPITRPHLTGDEGAAVAEAIKADPALRRTVVILLTSIGHIGELRTGDSIPVDASLVKPVRQSQLLNAMTTAWSRREAAAAPVARTAASHAMDAAPYAGTGLRVLVAEDNVVNQKVAARMLERLGLRVDVAANGREAIAMLEILPYDLVLMDCHMPEMDGYAATGEIRRRGGRRVPIIAMTAEAMEGSREGCLQAGMDDYVRKPVTMKELGEALQRWLPQNAGEQGVTVGS